jgi:hypothetical protein
MNESSRAVTGVLSTISAILLALILGRTARAYQPPPVIVPPSTLDERDAHDTGDAGVVDTAEPVPAPGPMCLDGSSEAVHWDSPPTRLGALLYGAPTEAESEATVALIDGCTQTTRAVADPWLVLALLRLEDDAGAPSGMLASVWCVEASMRTVAARTSGPIRGDYLEGEGYRAHGPAQAHGWLRDWCDLHNGEADDFLPAFECYLSRAIYMRDRYALACSDSWAVGEALTANWPAYRAAGCKARSKHWRVRAKAFASLPVAP